MENATCRIPPIPLETLVVLAWLFKLLGRRFGATVMSPHGARTGAAEHETGAKRRPKIWSAKRDFLAKSEKTVSGVTWVRSSFLPKVAATRVPHQNESFVELIGDQRFRI